MAWNIVLTLLGGTLLVLGLSAGLIRNRWYVSEPLGALLIGAVAGAFLPPSFAVLNGDFGMSAAEQAARITLTIALVDIATDLPPGYLLRRWKPLLLMLGAVMPLMWLLSSLVAGVVLGLSVTTALLVGAVLTPTDPVLAASIATGKLADEQVPSRLRHLVLAESGANDALALLLVSFSLFLLGSSESTSFGHWVFEIVILEIAVGILIGLGAGWLTARALTWAFDQPKSERASLLSVALALALTLLGAARLLESDGILAAFVAGLVLNRSLTGELEEQKNQFHETMRRFFELPIFLFLGLTLPWGRWTAELGATGILLVVLLLLLRRLPALWLFGRWIGPIQGRRDTLFVGWFGPIGVAALYYAALGVKRTGDERIWIIATLVVACSILVHGITATAGTQWYGRGR